MSKEDSLIDSLKEEYLSQIRGYFPLNRLALLVVTLIVVKLTSNQTKQSISEALLDLKIVTFFDLGNGFFSSLTIGDFLIALTIIYAGIFFQHKYRNYYFEYIKKKVNLDETVKKLSIKSAVSTNGTIKEYFLLRRSESEANIWSKKIANYSVISESFAVLTATFIYAGYFGGRVDYLISSMFFLGMSEVLSKSILVFLKKYIPHAAHLNGQVGLQKDISLPNGENTHG